MAGLWGNAGTKPARGCLFLGLDAVPGPDSILGGWQVGLGTETTQSVKLPQIMNLRFYEIINLRFYDVMKELNEFEYNQITVGLNSYITWSLVWHACAQ